MKKTVVDPFTKERLRRFVHTHRQNTAQLPMLTDFAKAGFSKEVVEAAVRDKILLQCYVTLTNGATAKGFKLS